MLSHTASGLERSLSIKLQSSGVLAVQGDEPSASEGVCGDLTDNVAGGSPLRRLCRDVPLGGSSVISFESLRRLGLSSSRLTSVTSLSLCDVIAFQLSPLFINENKRTCPVRRRGHATYGRGMHLFHTYLIFKSMSSNIFKCALNFIKYSSVIIIILSKTKNVSYHSEESLDI